MRLFRRATLTKDYTKRSLRDTASSIVMLAIVTLCAGIAAYLFMTLYFFSK